MSVCVCVRESKIVGEGRWIGREPIVITEGVVVCLHSIEMLFSYVQNTKQTKVTLSTKQTRGKIIKKKIV